MSLLVTHARLITIPAGTADPGYIEDGWMLIEDGRIAAIGSGTPDAAADETLDVAGAFVALLAVVLATRLAGAFFGASAVSVVSSTLSSLAFAVVFVALLRGVFVAVVTFRLSPTALCASPPDVFGH